MDVVTSAVIAALSLLSEPLIKDAYDRLKTALTKRFSKDSDLIEAVAKLEQKPDSVARRETLREEVVAAKADQDEDIVRAAEVLLDELKSQPGGQQLIQQSVTGDRNVFSGTGDVTVHKNS
jgi:hypothetical protein